MVMRLVQSLKGYKGAAEEMAFLRGVVRGLVDMAEGLPADDPSLLPCFEEELRL